jgi:hypothetical protein
MAFNLPTQVSLSKYRPVTAPVAWARAGDWPTITDTAGEVQFLVSDLCAGKYSVSTEFTQTGGVGNIYIDWGDGTTTTISTTGATTSNKTYTIGAGTACSRGYTTFKIRIYGDAGTTITRVKFLPPFTGKANSTSYGVLEAYYGNNTITDFNSLWGFAGGNSGATFLEYVKMPATLGAIDMDSAFYGCVMLTKIDMPTSMSTINFRSAFRNCYALQSITFPSDALLGDCFNGFNGCNALNSITLPASVTSITNLNGTFNGCRSLGNVIFPTGLDSCTDLGSCFLNCSNLITVEIPGFYTGVATNTLVLSNAFQGCAALQYVKLPNTYRAGLILSMGTCFTNCYSLLSLDLSAVPDISTLVNVVQNCYSLASITLPTTCSSLSSMANAFQNAGIQEITLPTTVAASITLGTAFSGCINLSSVTIPSSYNITSLTSTFQNCTSLTSVNLPNNAQNSLTAFSNTFSGCQALQTVIMPTSLNSVSTMINAFSNCFNLLSVTLPATMNSLISLGSTFSGCQSLTSVTLPTSATVLTTFSNIFQNCFALTSVTLPATISASTLTFSTAFSGCFSLKTITLPTTQTTSLNSMISTFANCLSLTTINNTGNLGNTSTGSTTYINATLNTGMDSLTTLSFNTKFSALDVSGTASIPTALTSLRLLNNGSGQYAGVSPQLNVSNTSLGAAALDQLFTDLPTVVGRTINITGTPGAATCNRSIATGKGWTVTG